MDQWYHGSPYKIHVLSAGSTITQDMHLAEIFSHKPEIVSVDDEGRIMHNGHLKGYLYAINEELSDSDLHMHPRTAMEPGKEWLTNRELKLKLLMETAVNPKEMLTKEEMELLQASTKKGNVAK